jgi:hypothetical protein
VQRIFDNLETHVSGAVAHYWRTREAQKEKQRSRGLADAGLRSAVTGGAQMDGFVDLIKNIITEAGIPVDSSSAKHQ